MSRRQPSSYPAPFSVFTAYPLNSSLCYASLAQNRAGTICGSTGRLGTSLKIALSAAKKIGLVPCILILPRCLLLFILRGAELHSREVWRDGLLQSFNERPVPACSLKYCIEGMCYAQNRLPNLLRDGCPQGIYCSVYCLNKWARCKSKRFSTFTNDLRRCAVWLAENHCKDVCIDRKSVV